MQGAMSANHGKMGQAVSGSQIGSATSAPATDLALSRFSGLLERAAQITDRQEKFLDRMRGSYPKEATNRSPVPEASNVVARFEQALDALQWITDKLQENTVAMENLA